MGHFDSMWEKPTPEFTDTQLHTRMQTQGKHTLMHTQAYTEARRVVGGVCRSQQFLKRLFFFCSLNLTLIIAIGC